MKLNSVRVANISFYPKRTKLRRRGAVAFTQEACVLVEQALKFPLVNSLTVVTCLTRPQVDGVNAVSVNYIFQILNGCSYVFSDLLCQPWTWNSETMTLEQPSMQLLRRVIHEPFIFFSPQLLLNTKICLFCFDTGHVEVVKFLLEACKVNPFPKDR